ncbi:hypothetical protein ABIA39_009058 [Nocardia sp. GAS34]
MPLMNEKIPAGQAYRSLSESRPGPAHPYPPAVLRRRGTPFTTPLLSGRVNGPVNGRVNGVVKLRCTAPGCRTHSPFSALVIAGAGVLGHRDAGVVKADELDLLIDVVGAWRPVGGEAR